MLLLSMNFSESDVLPFLLDLKVVPSLITSDVPNLLKSIGTSDNKHQALCNILSVI